MRYDANAIEATGLVKRFGKTTALAGVDLVARPGRVLGLLGPNGAGKTTAVRILATLIRPDGGQASVCGYDVLHDAHQVRQLIGLTGQYASVDEGLSGTNNLIMIGRLLGVPRGEARSRSAELLARFDLADAALLPHIVRELDDRGIELAEFTLRKASMDEVFFALTGHHADEVHTGSVAREMEETTR